MITGDLGGRKVWFRISCFVIFYDKPDLRFSGFTEIRKPPILGGHESEVWGEGVLQVHVL
jgi:hypothetical protein